MNCRQSLPYLPTFRRHRQTEAKNWKYDFFPGASTKMRALYYAAVFIYFFFYLTSTGIKHSTSGRGVCFRHFHKQLTAPAVLRYKNNPLSWPLRPPLSVKRAKGRGWAANLFLYRTLHCLRTNRPKSKDKDPTNLAARLSFIPRNYVRLLKKKKRR